MNRIAIISDIHGNIPALDEVLSDIKNRNIERIFCLGDLVSLVRVPYNIEKAVNDAMESDMPDKQEYINELRTAVYRGRKKKEECL
ncbi:MAG: metallophosphatase family protein [Vallitalea sp.]|jgi:predicted phosphodiesterase|nr:metallophosphatase family protein [Vallitalea sp.]